MNLTTSEIRFLTALAREQNQTGCRGPAHDLLRQHAYPEAPREGPGSLAFSYEAVPLTGLLFRDLKDLEENAAFLREEEPNPNPEWPWSSAEDYTARLAEAKNEIRARESPAA